MRSLLLLLLTAAACSGPSHLRRVVEDGPPTNDEFRVAVLHHKVHHARRDTVADADEIVATNWRKTEELIRRAAGAGAKVIVAPEYSITGSHIILSERWNTSTELPPAPTDRPLWEIENPDIDGYVRDLARLSHELRVYIVANAFEREVKGDDIDYYNTMIATGPDGRLLASYRKINLYIYESVIETGGSKHVAFDTPWGRFGMLLCFDAIIPWTWEQVKSEYDCDFFVVASLWQQTPLPGRLAMNTLADMSGIPVLWANQASGGMGGDAGIIRPWATDTAMGIWGPEGVAVGNLEVPERFRQTAELHAGERTPVFRTGR